MIVDYFLDCRGLLGRADESGTEGRKKFEKIIFFSCNLYKCRVNLTWLEKKEVAMAKKNYELTEAEWAIMQAVWDNQPCAAPSVQEVLESERGWTYSTVKTMMDRMAAKGLLETERVRNLILYRSAITKQQAQKGEIMRAVKRAFDGALTPMMQFLIDNNKLSKRELNELETMIKKRRQKTAGKKRK